MKKISYCFLFILIFFGCGDESSNQDETVKDSVKDDIVVETGPEKEIVWEKDGKEMVLIPAGSFEMGDHHDNMSDELPVHTVTLDAFYMDTHEVTVGQFKKFLAESDYPFNGNWWKIIYETSPTNAHPMTLVSWDDVVAYVEWAGKRLPTEAEWEYAARGGLVGKRFPWGDDEKLARDYTNYQGTDGKDKWDKTAPVGSFEANGYGLYDMAGNVWEWCQDWYDGHYYKNSPANNPQGPEDGKYRVLRGGSWADRPTGDLRLASRSTFTPVNRYNDFGFRCVADIE